ncbi:hypothetical protein AYO21_08969 [Fonsecaea monophora]|uniref:Xylanolytic transcriptional activator regulatory domain-containing protein n=1 Tax=Fonsecaea monophora TaxID=254056 RepID=A0A177EYY6_9EURO|nr:hypothetical protein AYO21_08969 [Fonsecaea monophora]OAG36796.1 hypothetical protein AYO21_08969 [Fonsecaea monophora]
MPSLTITETQGHIRPLKRRMNNEKSATLTKKQCLDTKGSSAAALGANNPTDATPTLPAFVKPLPSTMLQREKMFLFEQDALTIPSFDCARQLIRSYCHSVHPYMPLLDCDELIALFESDTTQKSSEQEQEGPYSLLLLQAVFFCGSAFVDLATVRAMGFETRQAAREALYARAMLLYDFKYEQDLVTTLQTLLLFTHWVEHPEDDRYTWFWMSAATSLVQSLDLPNLIQRLPSTARQAKLLRRIWWACFMRETILALTLRYPRKSDYADMPLDMLRLDDFDFGEARQLNVDRKTNDLMAVELAKLCLCINRILSIQSSLAVWSNHPILKWAPQALQMDQGTLLIHEMNVCESWLSEWQSSLPQELATPLLDDQTLEEHEYGASMVNRIALRLGYNLAVMALFRPHIHPSSRDTMLPRLGDPALKAKASTKLHDTADDTSRIAAALVRADLTKYLPSYTITVFFSALIFQHIESKTCGPEQLPVLRSNFDHCKHVAMQLGTRYQHAVSFMRALEPELVKHSQDASPQHLSHAFEGKEMLGASWTDMKSPTRPRITTATHRRSESGSELFETLPLIEQAPVTMGPWVGLGSQESSGVNSSVPQLEAQEIQVHDHHMPEQAQSDIDIFVRGQHNSITWPRSEPRIDRGLSDVAFPGPVAATTALQNSGNAFMYPETLFGDADSGLIDAINKDFPSPWAVPWADLWAAEDPELSLELDMHRFPIP